MSEGFYDYENDSPEINVLRDLNKAERLRLLEEFVGFSRYAFAPDASAPPSKLDSYTSLL